MTKEAFLSIVKSSYEEANDIQFIKFEKIEINQAVLEKVEFENCMFENCKMTATTIILFKLTPFSIHNFSTSDILA